MNRVALLRAVNVGGRKVVMADLRALFVRLGFADAKTLLNSGNVVFKADRRSDASLEKLFETETEKKFKIKAEFFVRTTQEMKAIVAANPFPKEATSDPGHLLVVFLKDVPNGKDVAAVQAANKGTESIRAVGKNVYVYYPDGVGDSKLRLPWVGSGRNWNTVLKLIALLS
ncbi:MAG: DUF1697 domain-containing protein [Vulcanimicrobiaceae bacterium]